MPSARLHPNRREIFGSLRFRLTLWNTAVVLLVVLFTLWGVREGLRFILWHEADEQLVEDARKAKVTYEELFPDIGRIQAEFDREARTHTHRGLHMRIFDPQRTVLWTSENAPDAPFPVELISHGLHPVTAGHYRLVHVEANKPGVPAVTIRVGTSFGPLEDDIALITKLLLGVGSIALFISPLGGFWLAGRATRPIAQIIDTTNRLHPASLDERLPLRGTRDELDRLSATINGFLDRIAAYLQQNRDFTASAAHELRSPLAAIQNSLEVALNSDRSVEEYKELLAELLDECEGLRVLVNQLLLLAESDSGTLQPGSEVVALDQVVQRAYDMFLGVAESADVDLRLGRLEPVRVCGDAGRLRQVVNNLLDNAIKYTKPGGLVAVSLVFRTDDDSVRLVVRDTGMGISADNLPYIFDRFFRGDRSRQRDRQSRGLGLGLAICRSIVTAHNGHIAVESVPDRGTTITVILPAAPTNTQSAAVSVEGGLQEAYGQPASARPTPRMT
ncbi:MAG TPA: ATP-binding protein [Planctomycetaceae bacterium]|nr:ATP-binding protein [Planctomycetaceae bacterium]